MFVLLDDKSSTCVDFPIDSYREIVHLKAEDPMRIKAIIYHFIILFMTAPRKQYTVFNLVELLGKYSENNLV